MPWHRVPRALRVLALAAAWFSYGVVLSNLNSPIEARNTAPIIWAACLFGYCISALVTLIRPALFSSAEEFVTYRTALRTGDLPEDVDLSTWERRLSRSRLATILGLWCAFPYLGFGALSADSIQTQYRAFLLCMFTLSGIWVCVAVYRRTAHIKQLESAVRRRQDRQHPKPVAPVHKTMPWAERQWRSSAEATMAARLITTAMATTALAFVPLLLADLDSIVYSDSRLSRLAWIVLCATVTGVVVTRVGFWDPRLRATTRTIESILQYDRAFRTGELPDQFDADQWRNWMKGHHTSDAITLIWAGFYLIVGLWSVLCHQSGYHWVVALVLASLAIWQVRRWQFLCRLNTRLKTQVERHSIRQLFG